MKTANRCPCEALTTALCLVISSMLLPGQTWTNVSIGLPTVAVGGILQIVTDPNQPTDVYALTEGGRLFKSTDGAESWSPFSYLAGVSSIVIEPLGSHMYVTTNHGVFRSSDHGLSWMGANAGLTATLGGRLFIDPVTQGTLYFVAYPPRIFRSTDRGQSWVPTGGVFPGNITNFVVDPSTPNTMYASTEMGVFKSTDGAESWIVLDLGLPQSSLVTALVIAPGNPATFYAAYTDRVTRTAGMQKSSDGGQSWSALVVRLPPRSTVYSVVVDPTNLSTIYVVYDPLGLIKTTDGGKTWQEIDEGLPASPGFRRFLTLDPANPAVLYVACTDYRGAGGVFKRTSGSTSWNHADYGLHEVDIRTVAVDPRDAGTVYAGGRDSLFQSTDAGANWTNLASFLLPAPNWSPPLTQPPPFGAAPARIVSVVVDFANPNILYVQTLRYNACAFSDRLIFKSVDKGRSWSDGASPPFTGCALTNLLVLQPSDSNTIYMAANDDGAWLLKSTDGGGNWARIWDWTKGMESTLNALIIDPADPKVLYGGLGEVGFTPQSPYTGLIKSTDGGLNWKNNGLAGNAVTVLAMDFSRPSTVYAATEGLTQEPKGFRGLYKTSDGGATWLPINNGLEDVLEARIRITAIVVHPRNPDLLYLGTAGTGIYRSDDAGSSWSSFNDGISQLNVRALAISSDDLLYAATPAGVFKSVDAVAAAHATDR